MRTLVGLAAVLALAAGASAGSAEAPEITDPSGDCSVPYGNAYLDVVSAWVDGEDEDSFLAHVQLAGFQAALSPGSGLAMTFEHQGARYGVIAADTRPFETGWGFWSGTATETEVDTFEDAPGTFDEGTGLLTVEFPKWLFPHAEAANRDLTGFRVFTADIRPALPFMLADLDENGKWIVCDVAESDAVYTFMVGGHSGQHDAAQTAANGAPVAAASLSAASTEEAAPPASENATPGPSLLAVAAAAGVAGMAARAMSDAASRRR